MLSSDHGIGSASRPAAAVAFDPWESIRGVDDIPRPLVGRQTVLPQGAVVPAHAHRKGQLLFASAGVLSVRTRRNTWTVTTNRGVWLPPGQEHEVKSSSSVHLRSLFIDPEHSDVPDRSVTIDISDLLRELILRVIAMSDLYAEDSPDERLAKVLLEQLFLRKAPAPQLPLPRDPRLLRVTEALFANPADKRSLADFSKSVGASARTLTRLFQEETKMPFRQWRLQLRLLEGLARLMEDQQVKTVALDLKYNSSSAFVSAFRKHFGMSPKRYLELSR